MNNISIYFAGAIRRRKHEHHVADLALGMLKMLVLQNKIARARRLARFYKARRAA